MIVTVTLNPAVDHTLVLPKFVAGDTIRVRLDQSVEMTGVPGADGKAAGESGCFSVSH